MAFRNFFNKSKDTENGAKNVSSSKGFFSRRESKMADVINEGVVSSSLEIMKGNSKFIIEDKDGNDRYVGLYLKVSDIGGLSKKDKRDKDKGALAQAINTSGIKTLISEKMLENEEIIFIPVKESIEIMEGFSILRGAPYHWALVSGDGSFILDEAHEAEFSDLIEISEGGAPVSDFISEGLLAGHLYESDDFEEIVDDEYEPIENEDKKNTEKVNKSPKVSPLEDMFERPSADGEEEEFSNDPIDDGMDLFTMDDNNHDDFVDLDDIDDEMDDSVENPFENLIGEEIPSDDEDIEVEKIVINEDSYQNTIDRLLFKDDLDLHVTSDDFDEQFLALRPNEIFKENLEDSWLNNYLSELSKAGNRDLVKLFDTNIGVMRNKYVNTLSRYAETIEESLDFNNPTSSYYAALGVIKDYKSKRLKNVDDDLVVEIKNIDKNWEETLDKIAKLAAENAKMDYERKHGREIEASKRSVRLALVDSIEAEYQINYNELNEQRKMLARKKLDLAKTQVLRLMAEDFETYLAKENEVFKAHQRKMGRFLEENRQKDVDRIHLLEKEVVQNNKVDSLRSEYEAKISMLNEDLKTNEIRLTEQITRLSADYKERLDKLSKNHNDEVQRLISDKENLKEQNEKALEEYTKLKKEDDERYQKEYLYLKRMAESSSFVLKHYAGLVLVGFALAAVLGGLIGMNFGSSKTASKGNDAETIFVDENGNQLPKNENGDYIIKGANGEDIPLKISN